jgi:SAM-dependent methyltransferase
VIGRVVGRGVRRVLGGFGWALDAASRAVLYIDAGTRPLSAMHAATRETWQDFNADAASVAAGWMPWERRLVRQYVAASDRVLLIGSGTGRDLIPFAEMGCRVTGIEPVAGAVEIAKHALVARKLEATMIVGFVEDEPLDGEFEVIMFSYHCYSYMFDSSRRVALLRKLRRHLAEGGRVLLTCHGASNLGQPQSRLLSLARAANRWRNPGWRLEPGDYFERVRGTAFPFHYLHVFTTEELETEATRAGFSRASTDIDDAYVLRPRM